MTVRVTIKPDNIIGAIRRAGIAVDEYLSFHPMVKGWVDGTTEPTVKQLEQFSKQVHIPFGFLFLDHIPETKIPFPFFRSNSVTQVLSLNVSDTITQLQARQDWLRDYLIDQERPPLTFVGKFTIKNSVNEVVSDIRVVLGLADEWALMFDNWTDALRFLIKRLEEVGIVVVLNGVVGNSTKRTISTDECRGFVLVDDHAPFLFINASDTKAAQMFTLVHELAHIWLGKSAGFDFDKMLPADDPVEKFCDSIAAEFLVPKKLFLERWRNNVDFNQLAKSFKVSPIVIARRALDLGAISKEQFFAFYNAFMSAFKEYKEKLGGGGNFEATFSQRLSPLFASYLDQATKYGELLYRDAYKLAGVKGDTFHKFVQK